MNKEQFSAKIKSISTKLKKLWLICAKIIFCPPHTWMRSVCVGRTWKCPNCSILIGPNDLIFLLKDRQLNFQEESGTSILCTISRFRDIYSWIASTTHLTQLDKFWREILSKIKPTATLLQFADEVFQIKRRQIKSILDFWIRNNSVQKSSPYLQNWRSYGWYARELFFVRLILEWDRCVVVGLRTALTCLILVQMTWFFY